LADSAWNSNGCLLHIWFRRLVVVNCFGLVPPLDTTTLDRVHKRHCAFDTLFLRTLKKSHTLLFLAILYHLNKVLNGQNAGECDNLLLEAVLRLHVYNVGRYAKVFIVTWSSLHICTQ
jgi:hypothetical protein